MQQAVTTHSGIAQMLNQTIKHYGLDPQPLFTKAGLEAPESLGSEARLRAVAMQKVWHQAVEATGDEAFGITFAEQIQPMALHGLGFSWMVSDTLKDAFLRLVRYYRLISTGGEIVLQEEHEQYRLWYKLPGPRGIAVPASIDAAMALFIQLCRLTKSSEFKPTRVELQRPKPTNTAKFDAFFQCPIAYDSPDNSLFFSRSLLNEPLPNANPALARANDQVVIDYLKQHDKQDIISTLRALIIENLPSGTLDQNRIASELHMSARSLQRKLRERDSSFTQIVENVRKELAQSYLRDAARSVGEVTYLLGYTEPSNFSRSFKKWTGLSPAEYQNRYSYLSE